MLSVHQPPQHRPAKAKTTAGPPSPTAFEYSGGTITGGITAKEGIEQPRYYWDPVIAPGGMTFYTGDKLPKWKGDIFVGGQRTGEIPGTGRLERVLVNEKLEELRREALLVPLRMRIRDVRQGPDELLYVLVDHENGGVLRIEPSASKQQPTTSSARPPR